MSAVAFSIVIPTYNYAPLLERAVQSAFAQPGDGVEVIVVDDGSTDDTAAVVGALGIPAGKQFRFLRQANRGAAAARNRGIAAATHPYIVFLDADDALCPGMLQHVRQAIDQHPSVELLIGAHQNVTPDGDERLCLPGALPEAPLARFRAFLDKRINTATGALVYHRRVFERIQFPEQLRQAEDLPVLAQTLALFECRTLDTPLVRIYKHADSLRHDADRAEETGLDVVDALFDPAILPPPFMAFRRQFMIQRCLSVFRTLYRAGRFQSADNYFRRAVRESPTVLLRWPYVSKYLRMRIRRNR